MDQQKPIFQPKPLIARWRQQMAFGFFCLILTGLFTFDFFRVLPGIGIGGLLLLALLQPALGRRLYHLKQQPVFWGMAGVFLFHAAGILYTPPAYYALYFEGLKLKLPFLLLPLALFLLPPFPRPVVYRLYYLFFFLVLLAAAYSMFRYALDYQNINLSYHRAGMIPTLVNHVRFSLMVVLAVFIGLRLLQIHFYLFSPRERVLLLTGTSLLVILLHLLAVRSGLLTFYCLLLAGGTYYSWKRGQLQVIIFLLAVVALGIWGSYQFLPTFRERINYTRYDLEQVQDPAKANDYSLTARLYSYRVGLKVWRESPVWGTGMGQGQAIISRGYARFFPQIKPTAYLIPHNQFLYYLVLLGAAGLLAFMLGFYLPLVLYFKQSDPLLWVQYGILSLSFLFEATLETQVGLIFSLVFILLPIRAGKA